MQKRGWLFCTLGLCVLLSACAGQIADGTPTPATTLIPVAAGTLPPTPIPVTDAPPTSALTSACSDPTQAQQAAITFLKRYNAGDVEGVMALLAPDLRLYLDAADGFKATGETLPDIRGHLTGMAAAHDKLSAAAVDAQLDPGRVVVDYQMQVNDLTRTRDALPTGTHGKLEMAVHCDTLLFTVIAFETH